MIAANELRRGNYCFFDSTIDRVTEIYETGCNAEFKSRWSYDRIHPIVLTPEILEKAGFRPNAVGNLAIEINDISTHLELIEANGLFYPSIDQAQDIGSPQNVALNRIQYLHQLQNLYFALTGQELTIKL